MRIRSGGDDLSIFHHADLITFLYGGGSVGNHDNGPLPCTLLNRTDEIFLCDVSQGRGGFIHYDELRMVIQGPCDTDTLTLSSGKPYASLTHQGIHTLRETSYQI